MKNHTLKLVPFFSRLNRRNIQLFLAILYTVLLVLGAGAPGAGGDIGL